MGVVSNEASNGFGTSVFMGFADRLPSAASALPGRGNRGKNSGAGPLVQLVAVLAFIETTSLAV
jgi:hypothetical protein